MDVLPMIKGIQAVTGSASADKRQQAEVKPETNSASSDGAKPLDTTKQSSSAHAHLRDEVTHLSTDNLTRSISEQADIDKEKVTVIKDAISKGEYPLDPQKIAQAFLTLESVLN